MYGRGESCRITECDIVHCTYMLYVRVMTPRQFLFRNFKFRKFEPVSSSSHFSDLNESDSLIKTETPYPPFDNKIDRNDLTNCVSKGVVLLVLVHDYKHVTLKTTRG